MTTIFYSMAGEGRGHATRARAAIERLRDGRRRFVVLAPRDAYRLLASRYEASDDVVVEEIPGLFFAYDKRGRVAPLRTAWAALGYALRLPGLVRRVARRLEQERPQLALTDFEGSLARAAHRCGVPLLSVDHQHFLVVSDFSDLPRPLRLHAKLMSLVVRAVVRGQQATITSSFYFPRLKRQDPRIHQVGVLLRPEVRATTPTIGNHLCVYVRRTPPDGLLDALVELRVPARVYGLGERPNCERLTFCPISEDGFLADLASCRALVSTAGNQLVGEALWLHKPVFAIPEANNHEQRINATYLQRSGAGVHCPADDVHAARLRTFLDSLGDHRAAAAQAAADGVDETVRVVEQWLGDRDESASRPAPEISTAFISATDDALQLASSRDV